MCVKMTMYDPPEYSRLDISFHRSQHGVCVKLCRYVDTFHHLRLIGDGGVQVQQNVPRMFFCEANAF